MSCKLEMMCQKLSGKILLPIQKPSKINPSVSSKSPQVIVVHAMQCCDHTDPPNNLLRFSVFCLLIVRHTYLLVRSTNIITTKQCDTLLNFRTVYTVQQPLCRSSIFLQKKSVVMVLKRYHSRLTRRLFLLFWALVLSICCLLLRCCG